MTRWTAIVPMKAEGKRKTRLAGSVSRAGREELSENLFYHVVRTLRHCPSIGRVVLLSDGPPLMAGLDWIADAGGGLNAELARALSAVSRPALIVHADLPLLEVDDVEALIVAARTGAAIAPDDRQTGTNAVALADDRAFTPMFGPGSFERHRRQAPDAAVVTGRVGLALDIDTAEDLQAAVRLGFSDQ